MEKTKKLVSLLREAESLLENEGNYKNAAWIGDICASISLGNSSAIEDLKNNIGGMGDFWESSNDRKFAGVIERSGEILDEPAF